jgi:hypothetical protein
VHQKFPIVTTQSTHDIPIERDALETIELPSFGRFACCSLFS